MSKKESRGLPSDKNIVKYLLLTGGLILAIIYSKQIFSVVGNFFSIVFPLILGCAIAYVLNLIVVNLEKIYFPKAENKWIRKTKMPICLILAILLIVVILFFVIKLVVPELINTITTLSKTIPSSLNNAADYFKSNDNFPIIAETIKGIDFDWNEISKNVMTYATQGFGGVLDYTVSIVGNVTSGVFKFIVACTFAIYLLISKEKLFAQIKRVAKAFMKKNRMASINKVLKITNEAFSSFIIGQFTEAIILGSLCAIGMLLLRIPYALTIGTFIGVTALIPIFGAWIGAIIGCILIVTIDPVKAFIFIIFIVVLQQIENNLIYPKVVGTSIGLPGIWVFSAILIGGGLSGIVGMLLSVPIAATVYKLVQLKVRERLGKK